MESYWVYPRAERLFLLDRDDPHNGASFNANAWETAEHQLRSAWDRHSRHGRAGILYRDAVIRPLHDRFNDGERSLELLCAIRTL